MKYACKNLTSSRVTCKLIGIKLLYKTINVKNVYGILLVLISNGIKKIIIIGDYAASERK